VEATTLSTPEVETCAEKRLGIIKQFTCKRYYYAGQGYFDIHHRKYIARL